MSTAVSTPPTRLQCPICGSERFGDFRNRVNVRCSGCGSFERSRLLWLVLSQLDLESSSHPFFHVAPEIGIAKQLHTRLGERYRAFDFSPDIYAKAGVPVGQLDLCKDLARIESSSIGTFCHVHVLEHVRCNATLVLQQINRALAPGGHHIFGVPFFSHQYREDLSDNLTDENRLELFGHEDHIRSFGDRDFDFMFGSAFDDMEYIPVPKIIDHQTASKYNIPARALLSKNSHSLFIYKKQ